MTFIIVIKGIIASAQWSVHELVTTDSVRITYFKKGQGKPVLLLSGGPGYNGAYLFSLVDSLAASEYNSRDIEYIIPDLRGTGSSPVLAGQESKITFDKVIGDLEQIRKNERIDTWTLVGHSFGGIIAQHYALLHPANLKAILLLSAVAPDGFWGSNILSQKAIRLREDELKRLDQLSEQMNRQFNEQLRDEYNAIMIPVYLAGRKDTANLLRAMSQTKLNKVCFDAMMDNNRGAISILGRQLSPFKGPVAIIQGRLDPIGESQAYEIQKLLPQGEIIFISRAGHFLWVENPAVLGIHVWSFFRKSL